VATTERGEETGHDPGVRGLDWSELRVWWQTFAECKDLQKVAIQAQNGNRPGLLRSRSVAPGRATARRGL